MANFECGIVFKGATLCRLAVFKPTTVSSQCVPLSIPVLLAGGLLTLQQRSVVPRTAINVEVQKCWAALSSCGSGSLSS